VSPTKGSTNSEDTSFITKAPRDWTLTSSSRGLALRFGKSQTWKRVSLRVASLLDSLSVVGTDLVIIKKTASSGHLPATTSRCDLRGAMF